jgi:hypothetical protein
VGRGVDGHQKGRVGSGNGDHKGWFIFNLVKLVANRLIKMNLNI